MESDFVKVHKHSSNHRDELTEGEYCGCFYYLSIFEPSKIVEWIDEIEGVRITAMGPNCGIDSVIGSNSGYPIPKEFLSKMRRYWF